jgi:hypothetical protein
MLFNLSVFFCAAVLFLFEFNGKAVMPILKEKTLDSAESSLDKLTKQLGIAVI